MQTLFQPTTVLILFVLIRAGDIAISSAIVRDPLRAIVYWIVAGLALVATLFILFIH